VYAGQKFASFSQVSENAAPIWNVTFHRFDTVGWAKGRHLGRESCSTFPQSGGKYRENTSWKIADKTEVKANDCIHAFTA